MLKSISFAQLMEWKVYEKLEPFPSERADYNTASITHALWNIARDRKQYPDGWPLSRFILSFGDNQVFLPKQDNATLERIVDSWVLVQNAMVGGSRG